MLSSNLRRRYIMTPNDLSNLITLKLNGVEKQIKREGRKTFMKITRGRKTITLHISDKVTMKKRNGKIVDLPYNGEEIIKGIKKELNI
jgi:hypothetical protein